MRTHTDNQSFLLIPGHWFGAWAWDEVLKQLTDLGRQATALTLPGLDETDSDRAARTLEDQAAAIEAAIPADPEQVVIVAHRGANAPVSMVLDRQPHRVKRVVWVDSGPIASGMAFAPDFPEDVEEQPLPPFDVLAEQASLEGLTDEMLARFRARAVPEPGPVLRQSVVLSNDERYDVPTTLLCCSMPSAQKGELINSGHPMFAEVGQFRNVDYIDLPTGHWPMWSRPTDLARILANIA